MTQKEAASEPDPDFGSGRSPWGERALPCLASCLLPLASCLLPLASCLAAPADLSKQAHRPVGYPVRSWAESGRQTRGTEGICRPRKWSARAAGNPVPHSTQPNNFSARFLALVDRRIDCGHRYPCLWSSPWGPIDLRFRRRSFLCALIQILARSFSRSVGFSRQWLRRPWLDPEIPSRIVGGWRCPVVPFRWVWMVHRRSFALAAGLPPNLPPGSTS